VRFAPELYDGHAPDLLALARGMEPARLSRILTIGHNPAISEAGRLLAREGDPEALSRLARGMPTAGLAVLKFEASAWHAIGAGTLVRLIRPEGGPGRSRNADPGERALSRRPEIR